LGSAQIGHPGPRRGSERAQPRQRISEPDVPAQSSQRCGKARLATSMALRRTLSNASPRKFDNGHFSLDTAPGILTTADTFMQPLVDPRELVRTIAVARITMPMAMMRLSAGRRDRSDGIKVLCFFAGANSIFYWREASGP
jgi:hypothetical protein